MVETSWVPVSGAIANKADHIAANPAMLQLFIINFSDIYGIELTTDEAIELLGQVSMGRIPNHALFIKAVVMLDERF